MALVRCVIMHMNWLFLQPVNVAFAAHSFGFAFLYYGIAYMDVLLSITSSYICTCANSVLIACVLAGEPRTTHVRTQGVATASRICVLDYLDG